VRGRPGHHRPGNRSQCEARDHQDREQPAYGQFEMHGTLILKPLKRRKSIDQQRLVALIAINVAKR
jgi:hypothetical protein